MTLCYLSDFTSSPNKAVAGVAEITHDTFVFGINFPSLVDT